MFCKMDHGDEKAKIKMTVPFLLIEKVSWLEFCEFELYLSEFS